MPRDEVQPLVIRSGPLLAGTAGALLRKIRLSQAETSDITLFIAPGRLHVARQLLVSGLFGGMPQPETLPSNDN